MIPRRHRMQVTQPMATLTVYRTDTWWTWLGRVFGGRERIDRIVENPIPYTGITNVAPEDPVAFVKFIQDAMRRGKASGAIGGEA